MNKEKTDRDTWERSNTLFWGGGKRFDRRYNWNTECEEMGGGKKQSKEGKGQGGRGQMRKGGAYT